MLVLSRKKNERILIGDNVWIEVIEIRGDKVRIGIDAPKHVNIVRQEVMLKTLADAEVVERTEPATIAGVQE